MANASVKCSGCPDRFLKSGMVKIQLNWFHSYECAAKHGQAKAEKARERKAAKEAKEVKQEASSRKKKFKQEDVPRQHKLTQTVFNKMRVLEEKKWFADRGLEPECISCGKKMDWCCGHYKTVGAQGVLRYDKDNTKLQCNRNCNMMLSGNINGSKQFRGR